MGETDDGKEDNKVTKAVSKGKKEKIDGDISCQE